jgi:superfamily II DNA or RNA helicase
MKTVRFDRGTLELGADAPDVPQTIWDPRSNTRRVAAFRFAALVEAAENRGRALDGDLRTGWRQQHGNVAALELRPYQAHALASWTVFARRGGVALPTGAGKTRVAIAAIFDTGLPTAILCPTKALAIAWVEELRRHLDEPIGLVGDGQRSLERVTVLTFESA